jgi:hypothetical protein
MISFRTAQPTRARTAALALLCAAALGVAACGGGDDESSTSSASTATTNPQSQFFARLAQLLTKQGYTEKQADCVVSQLQETLSDAELADILSTAQISGAAKKDVAKAATGCAKTTGG